MLELRAMKILWRITTFLLIGLVVFTNNAHAQLTGDNYPVQSHVYVNGAGTRKVAELFSSSTKLSIDLILKDLTKTTLPVYLEWQLEGIGLGVQVGSTPGFVPSQNITLQKGRITTLKGIDLREYFQPGVVDVAGVSEAAVFNGSLPEGFYVIRVRAYEAGTGRVVSNRAETFFSIAYALPPIINLPFSGSEVPVTRPQNVLLQWTPRHNRTPSSSVLYNVTVCPVAEDEEPYAAMNSRADCFQLPPQTSTTYNLSGTDLPLQLGQRYAVQVQAVDLNESIEFRNDGYSQTTWFRYGKECTAPERLTVNEIGAGRVNVSWKANEQALGYLLEYKPEDETDWTRLTTLGTSSNIYDLKPDQTYLFRVATTCAVGYNSPFSDEETYEVYGIDPEDKELDDLIYNVLNPLKKRISGDDASDDNDLNVGNPSNPTRSLDPPSLPTTLADLLDDPTQLPCAGQLSAFENCNVATPTASPTGTIPLTSLAVGDYLTVADYAVVITEVGSGLALSGKGLARLPFMNDVFVGVEFSGVGAIKDETKPGGCVNNVPASGFFRVRTMTQAELQTEEQSLINTIRERADPGNTLKTLDEVLTDYTEIGTDIKTKVANGEAITAEEREKLLKENTLLITALTGWQSDVEELTGGLQGEAIDLIRADIQALIDELESNKNTITNGGGYPMNEGLREKINEIAEAIKRLLENQEPEEPKISNVIAKKITDNSATITWDGDKRFTRYVVTYQKPGEGEVIRIVNNPEIELTGLGVLSEYTIKIKGYVSDNAVSIASKTITTINNAFPPIKNLVSEKISDSSVKLSWDKDKMHVKYKLKFTDQLGNINYAYPTTNEIALFGLKADSRYPFELIAIGETNLTAAATGEFATAISCNLTVSTSKATVKSGDQTVITAECTGEVTWSETTGVSYPNPSDRKTSLLTINPTQTNKYLAICTVTDGGKTKTCSQPVEITVESPICNSFYIEASKAVGIVAGEYVILTPKGCDGKIKWIGFDNENNVDMSRLNIPIHENTTIDAICTFNDGTICSVSKKLELTCKAFLEANRDRQEIRAEGYCTQGFLTLGYEFIEGSDLGIGFPPYQGINQFENFSSNLGSIEKNSRHDFRVIAACYDSPKDNGGELLCYSTKIELERRQGFLNQCRTQINVEGYADRDFCDGFKLNASDCGNRNKPIWYADGVELTHFMHQETIEVYPEAPTLYKVECGTCIATKLIEPFKTLNGKDFEVILTKSSSESTLHLAKANNGTRLVNISYKDFPLVFSGYQCVGKAAAYTIPVVDFTKNERYEGCNDNSSFKFAAPLKEETKLIFTCTAPNGRVDRIERTYVPQAESCLKFVDVPSEINLGEEVTLNIDYCNGTVQWFRGSEGTPFAAGLSITDAPCTNTTYTAKCIGVPACSESVTIKVNPCKIEILASIGNVEAKVGECVSLEVKGCEAGKVVWDDGSTGASREVSQLKDKTYTATCTTCIDNSCKDEITIKLEKQAPPKFEECPTLKLTYSPQKIEKCSSTLVKVWVEGCRPNYRDVVWNDTYLRMPEDPFEINVTNNTTVTVKCSSAYGSMLYGQIEINLEPNNTSSIEVSPLVVAPGFKTTFIGTGCYTEDCKPASYRWKLNEIETTGKTFTQTLTGINKILEVSCEDGSKKTKFDIKVEASEKCGEIKTEWRFIPNGVGFKTSGLYLSSNGCDDTQPSIWYKYDDVKGVNVKIASNAKKILVFQERPQVFAQIHTSYSLYCINSSGKPCQMYKNIPTTDESLYAKPPEIEEETTPDPCNELNINTSTYKLTTMTELILLSDWCVGGKEVLWYKKNSRELIATLKIGEISTYGTLTKGLHFFLSKCILADGTECIYERKVKVN